MRRSAFAAALFLWAAPVLAVGAGGLGLTVVPALTAAVVAAAVVAVVVSGPLDRRLGPEIAASRPLALALTLVAAVAIVRFGPFSLFIADVQRSAYSMAANDHFRLSHSCMSSYAESARFLHEGGHNIYDRDLYQPGNTQRQIGPLRVDPYHYPPPFLLLPQTVRAVAPDFWDFRRLWFALQAITLAGALVGLAAWIGGRRGAITLLGSVLLLTLPPVGFTFQQGNFQITALPLAVAAFALLAGGAHAAGGGMLAYAALAKIFPGVLVVPLLMARRWRAAAWVAGMGIALVGVTLAVQGTGPFRDFVSTSLPEISSGAAFPQSESTRTSRVNWSAYGQTVRLRHLGLTSLTQSRGLMLAQVYGFAVVALAAWAGWRRRFDVTRQDDRLALLLLAVSLVGLASFRSPFVGGVYGSVSTFWVIALFAARASSTRVTFAWLIGSCALAAAIWAIPSPVAPPSLPWIWISGALVAACMLLSIGGVVASVRTTGAPSPAPDRLPHGEGSLVRAGAAS